MRKPQKFNAAVLVALLLSLSTIAQAQQPDEPTAHGIKLFRQGNADEAIKILSAVVEKHPEDADAWYYLGLARYSQGLIGWSRESFEKTVALRPDSADAHAKLAYALILGNEPTPAIAMARRAFELGDQSIEAHYAIAEGNLRNGEPRKALAETAVMLKLQPDFLPALITESFAHQSLKEFSEAAASLERFLALSPADPEAKTWRDQLSALRGLASPQPGQPPAAFSTKEVTQKARVLGKPEPGYTEQGRKAGAVGTVFLRAVFTTEGEVSHILIVRALGYGLTTNAISAARAIKFIPAVKDGKPVSQYIQLEYTFNLY